MKLIISVIDMIRNGVFEDLTLKELFDQATVLNVYLILIC